MERVNFTLNEMISYWTIISYAAGGRETRAADQNVQNVTFRLCWKFNILQKTSTVQTGGKVSGEGMTGQ